MHTLIVVAGGLRDPGGVTRSMETLINSWASLQTPPTYSIVDPRGCGHIIWSPLFFLRAFLQILFERCRHKKIVSHINMCEYGSVLRKIPLSFFCKLLSIPVVLHVHGAETEFMYSKMPSIIKKLFRFCVEKAGRVVVLGASWQDFFCRVVGVNPDKVTVIPNGIAIPAALPVRSGAPKCKILFLGRLGRRKGVDILLQALSQPDVRRLQWTATLAGDGEVRKYKEEIERVKLDQRITILGWVSATDVVDLLKSADVLVLPSLYEGLPMAILEGMAYGLAVIATPVGAIGEVIIHRDTGLIVEPGNSASLAEALHTVIVDLPLRQQLGLNARSLAQARFDARDFGQRFIKIYETICASTLI